MGCKTTEFECSSSSNKSWSFTEFEKLTERTALHYAVKKDDLQRTPSEKRRTCILSISLSERPRTWPQVQFTKCLIQHVAIVNDRLIYRILKKSLISFGNTPKVQIVPFCIEAGLKVKNIPWIREYLKYNHTSQGQESEMECEKHRKLQSLIKLLLNPLPLTKTCQSVVRDYMISVSQGSSVCLKILQLPLPELLINALVLEDL